MTEILNNDNFEEKTASGVVLLDFYADWCRPCQNIAPIIDELSEEITDAKIYKVDTEASPDIAANYKVRSIPTFILLKDGIEVSKKIGALTKNSFIDLINENK